MIDPTELLSILGASGSHPGLSDLVARISPPCEKNTDRQLEQVWYTSLGAGIAIVVKKDIVDAVHLYSEMTTAAGEWSGYASSLPHDLRFGMPRSEVLERFGKPHKGTGVHWASYCLEDHGIRVGFARETLVALDLVWQGSDLLPPPPTEASPPAGSGTRSSSPDGGIVAPAEQCETKTRLRTDTATLVIFDPACLQHRRGDADDWWSIPRDEVMEINRGNVLFVGLGADGFYEVELVSANAVASAETSLSACLRNTSGRFFVGPGEETTGGDFEPEAREGAVFVERSPGSYRVSVGLSGARLLVSIEPAPEFRGNDFTESPKVG